MKPFAYSDGTVSREHWYFPFEKDGQIVSFAIPREVQATVALCVAKALLPGWRFLDLDDRTYGRGGSAEDIHRWRERFLGALSGTHRAESPDALAVADVVTAEGGSSGSYASFDRA